MKEKSTFVCSSCGYITNKWLGKCPECFTWNTLEEIKEIKENFDNSFQKISPIKINDIKEEKISRFKSGISEIDRILGGGIVRGSFILLGGAPGIGKSSIVLEIADKSKKNVLYVSGEESFSQIKIHSKRLNITSDKILILSSSNFFDIKNTILNENLDLIIIDSIQTIYNPEILSPIGSINQIKDITISLLKICKEKNISIILIGHITKDGFLAGPKILEHLVDTVLYFEDDKGIYRIIKSFKNRFGNIDEIAVFEMTSTGLKSVSNPDKIFYSDKNLDNSSGNVISTIIEGTMAINIEVQALVTKNGSGFGKRQVTGYDINRIFFLIAVLEKKLKFTLYNQDIFINIVGGIKIKDIAMDMAIITAIISSYLEIPIPKNYAFIGEIGLSGETRKVSFIQNRLNRIKSFGIKKLITSNNDLSENSIDIINIKNVYELLKFIKSIN